MMINRPEGIASADAGLGAQFRMMFEALWASPVRNRLLVLATALFIVITATAWGQNRLNAWNQPFYDALARRDLGAFITQLGVFAVIAGALLVLNVAQRWLGETAKVSMREGLVRDLIGNWMRPGHAFRLAQSGAIGINPDQRLSEDARHLTELSADLGIGLLQASVLLVTFIDVLWTISGQFTFALGGREFSIPGYMVWAAILYSCAASLLSYRVGRELVDRDVEHYAREADLRYSLVRVSDHVDAITLSGGEADEARHILVDLAAVLEAMRRIVSGVTRLTWVTAGSGWFQLIAPILVAAPVYFAGRISFGGLMVASGAFMQVQSSLRWFVDNFSAIADWRATLLRVAALRRAMIGADATADDAHRIELAMRPAGGIAIDNLVIDFPQGSTRLAERQVVIAPGERVRVAAEIGAGKTLLFRALAGLWSQGAGRITRPDGADILFLPRTPYLPPGTLRAALAYPQAPDTYTAAACEAALRRLDLDRLVPLLETTGRWDRSLPEDERQGLAFARLLLRRPAWIISDDCLGVLEAQTLQRVAEVLATDLKATGVLHIGNSPAAASLFTRELTWCATRRKAAAMQAQPEPRALAALEDAALLDAVQRQTLRFFQDGAHPSSSLARDRTGRSADPDGELVTTGGSGFGMLALLVAATRGWQSREEVLQRLARMLELLSRASRYHGVFPHFMDGRTGATLPFSALDDGGDLVETGLLCLGLLCVRQYFSGESPAEARLRADITALWESVEWDWHTQGGQDVLYWHWSPRHGWAINQAIRGWNECLLTYVLAAASPRHAIGPRVYHRGFAAGSDYRNGSTYYGVPLPLGPAWGGPLFFSHYAFCGLDPRGLRDARTDYWEQCVNHVQINRAWCIDNPGGHRGYGEDCWGLTASDDPDGYAAHAPGNDNGTLSPTAAVSSLPYAPAQSLRAVRHFLAVHGERLWGRHGFTDAFCPDRDWYADSFLAIDQGPIVAMIENHRSGLLWRLFMSVPDVRRGLQRLGFDSPWLSP